MTKVICAIIGTIIASLFIAPLFCMIVWNTFAWEFNLPVFSFWHWVAVVIAIRLTLGKTQIKVDAEE